MLVPVDVKTVTLDNLGGRPTNELVHIAKEAALPEVLDILVEHTDPLVRGALADNPNISDAIKRRLKVDLSEHVRNKAAQLKDPEIGDLSTGVARLVKNVQE